MAKPLITAQRTVEFAETDAAGLVHFSNYLRYVETAERALFEQWGIPLLDSNPDHLSGFPRVRVNCDYSAPLKFGDRIEISLTLGDWTARSIEWRFRIVRISPGARERVAKGAMTTVYATMNRAVGRIESASLPEALKKQLASVDKGVS